MLLMDLTLALIVVVITMAASAVRTSVGILEVRGMAEVRRDWAGRTLRDGEVTGSGGPAMPSKIGDLILTGKSDRKISALTG